MPEKPTVYIETSVVSYLVARPSRAPVTAEQQHRTRCWWSTQRDRFSIVSSQVVIDEAVRGDADESRKRLEILRQLPLLDESDASISLSREILEKSSLPDAATDDATHIAIAVTNAVEYLMTWNLRHIANAQVRRKVREIAREWGYASPTICTPEALWEGEYHGLHELDH